MVSRQLVVKIDEYYGIAGGHFNPRQEQLILRWGIGAGRDEQVYPLVSEEAAERDWVGKIVQQDEEVLHMSHGHPRKLPTFVYQGKEWTVDERLGEFRNVVFGEMPEFVPFSSPHGFELLKALCEPRE